MKCCLKCGNSRFYVKANKAPRFEVNGDGKIIAALDKFEAPTNEDIWTCTKCGFSSKGADMYDEHETEYYTLKGRLNTDGDYCLSEDMLSQYHSNIHYFNEEYIINYETSSKNEMRNFLEKLIVSIRVVYTHYWILPNLAIKIEDLHAALLSNNRNDTTITYSGNYEGTELTLRKVKRIYG